MAVFISVTTSPFEEVFELAQGDATLQELSGLSQNVRRPLRGLEIKRDTYATIKVFDALRRPIPFVDSSAPPAEEGGRIGQSLSYSNFILQSVQEQRVEKQQIVETFGEDYIYFFGERPRIYTFNAVLMNTRNFNWKSEWWTNYENTLRGTKLLERNARMYIYYDDVVIEGYMLQAQASAATDTPYMLPLTFQVFCTNHAFVSEVGSIFTPTADINTTPESGVPDTTSAVPDDPNVQASQAVTQASSQNSLTGFLREANSWFRTSTFQIAKALENVKNTLYGQYVAFPSEGIGNQLYVPPIQNQASFAASTAPSGPVPIFEQRDEYTRWINQPTQVQYDEAERARVRELLRFNSPQQLEQRARTDLRSLGLNVDRPNANYLLLGRAAFATGSYMASFGIQQATGTLDIAAGVDTGLLTE